MQTMEKKSGTVPEASLQNNDPSKKKKRTPRKKLLDTALALCLLIVAALVISRPIGIKIADRQHEKAIEEYIAAVNCLTEEELTEIKARAIEYNKKYALYHPYIWEASYGEFKQNYPTELSIPGTEVIGYIEIPSIDVRLPIYHYSSDESMSRGCGHSEGSSLPIGGTDGHSVICSHRNMSTAVTFEHLNKLKEGDTFSVTVLKDTTSFKVDNIRVVDPNSLEDYANDKVEEGKQHCTLLTCTPLIINTHRLLVRGVRID